MFKNAIKKSLIAAALATGAFIACQKTISWDLNAKASIITDSSGNCYAIPIHGTYKATSLLTDSNYIVVQVQVDSPGEYYMYSNYLNGYYFSFRGSFTKTGATTVKLVAQGTPVVSGADSFYVFLNSTSCPFTIKVLSADADIDATFELATDTTGNCSNAIVNGTYKVGQQFTDSNTIVLQVNVIIPGIYNVTTTLVNGMSFSSAGTFTSSGLQNITLKGTGTPAVAGDTAIPISVDTTNCSFVVPVLQ